VSAEDYLGSAAELLDRIKSTQLDQIREAAALMADSVVAGGAVNLFGSGHSVLPVMDIFPRYGGYPAFRPLIDARLTWFNVLGSGGVTELLWLERQEGYIENFLKNYPLRETDTMVIYSHGGLNAAGIETAQYAKRLGMRTVAVTSAANTTLNKPTHSSGKRLADLADVVIDNCTPPEDSLVHIDGWPQPVAAGSTLSVIAISMALVAELAGQLASRGIKLPVFVSPNVAGVSAEHNQQVFDQYARTIDRAGNGR
jgi:uncharacterized phosphosugar-binding protein